MVDGTATAPAATSKSTRNRRSAAERLAELKRRLHDIDDLTAAGAALGWDQATYMPIGGARARGRQRAVLSRLAHEKIVDPSLGRLLDELEHYVATFPYDSNEASLIRVAKRDFERAIKIPSDHVARASAFGAEAYEAWKRARPANDFATMLPFLQRGIDLGREYADFFAPYHHVADPLIDDADEGMTAASVRRLFAALRADLVPMVD